jgi:integrase
MGMPAGDTVLDFRDRAILKFFLYSGARLSTACRLKVSDFHQDGDEATIRLHEKGAERLGCTSRVRRRSMSTSRRPASRAAPSSGPGLTPEARGLPIDP